MPSTFTHSPERDDQKKIGIICETFIRTFHDVGLKIDIRRIARSNSKTGSLKKEASSTKAAAPINSTSHTFIEPTEHELEQLNLRVMRIVSLSEKRGYTRGSMQEKKMINEVVRLICEHKNWDFSLFDMKENNPSEAGLTMIEYDLEISYTTCATLTTAMTAWLQTEIKKYFKQQKTLNHGDHVVVHGLTKKPEYNGETGIIENYDPSSERYAIKLDTTKKVICVRPSNLAKQVDASLTNSTLGCN